MPATAVVVPTDTHDPIEHASSSISFGKEISTSARITWSATKENQQTLSTTSNKAK